MTRRPVPELPASSLTDPTSAEALDRVWRRLEAAPRVPAGGGRAGRLAVLVALAASSFAAGVLVGRGGPSSAEPAVTVLAPEPPERRAVAAPPAGERPPEPGVPERAAASRRAPQRRPAVTRAPAVLAASPVDRPLEPPVAESPLADWRRLADEGAYAAALEALEAAGGFDRALEAATAEELMTLVDVARATGQRARAVVALRRIVSAHGADPNAPVAAWMLGSELAKMGDASGAEQAFAMYRALSPGGDFAEDALGRQVDLAVAQGHVGHASVLARQYLREFPEGPRHVELQAQLDAWDGRAEPGDAGPPEPGVAAGDAGR